MLELNFPTFPVLRTSRMVLRGIELTDDRAVFGLRADPRVMQHIARPPAKTIDDAVALLRHQRSEYDKRNAITWAMTLHGDPELVGTIGLWRIDAEHHRGELGFLLRPDLWRQGLTREAALAVIEYAFATLHMDRIAACVYPNNTASIAVIESLGFTREGRLFEETFLDTVVYGRSRQ